MGDIHCPRCGDVEGGDVDGPADGDRVLEAHRRHHVHRVGAYVHLSRDGDWVVGVAPVHRRGDGCRDGHGCSRVRVADSVTLFVTGVEVGLSVSLQMAGDVRCTQHLPTDAAGHLALMSDHVGAQSVFGGKSRGTGRYLTFERSF